MTTAVSKSLNGLHGEEAAAKVEAVAKVEAA